MTIGSTTTGVLTIDLHHGHLDPEIATLPVPKKTADRVREHTETLLTAARSSGVPVFHVTTGYRNGEEILTNPKWRQTDEKEGNSRESISKHNLFGSKGLEIVPELRDDDLDLFLQPKKRYSPFLGTDLPFVLRTYGIDCLVIAGVNTNTCVQCTCFEASNRDYEVVVVEECVGSMDGEDLHRFALQNIDQSLGTVMTLDEALTAFDW